MNSTAATQHSQCGGHNKRQTVLGLDVDSISGHRRTPIKHNQEVGPQIGRGIPGDVTTLAFTLKFYPRGGTSGSLKAPENLPRYGPPSRVGAQPGSVQE